MCWNCCRGWDRGLFGFLSPLHRSPSFSVPYLSPIPTRLSLPLSILLSRPSLCRDAWTRTVLRMLHAPGDAPCAHAASAGSMETISKQMMGIKKLSTWTASCLLGHMLRPQLQIIQRLLFPKAESTAVKQRVLLFKVLWGYWKQKKKKKSSLSHSCSTLGSLKNLWRTFLSQLFSTVTEVGAITYWLTPAVCRNGYCGAICKG